MTPASILADLRRRGLSARAESGRLVLAPASLLTDDLRAAIRTHKAALLALVEADGLRVIVAGSRGIRDGKLVARAIAESGFKVAAVLCGDAMGADRLGAEWARKNGVPVRHFPADWKADGKAAGPKRNQRMADCAEALVLVWDGTSPGSADMLRRARAKGLRVFQMVDGVAVEDETDPFGWGGPPPPWLLWGGSGTSGGNGNVPSPPTPSASAGRG